MCLIIGQVNEKVKPLAQPTRAYSPNATRTVTPVKVNTQARQSELVDWYIATFIPDPARGYAMMNPPGHEEKYTRRSAPITRDLIIGSLNGETRRTRPLPVGGGVQSKWSSVATTFAITPQTKEARPHAKEIALDIDTGGMQAIGKVLDVCKRHGLEAFAQLSESATHEGGHVRIPCTELLPASMLNNIGHRIAQAAGVEAEVWPCDADLRLPLQIHLRAPGGPRRFPLVLPTGELIDAGDPWQALESLRTHLQPNATTSITNALETLPDLPEPEKQTQPRHRSKVNGGNVGSVISWFNENFTLQSVLEDANVTFKRENQHFVCCPFHEDDNPSLAIWRHKDNDKHVCHCYSKNSNCPASKGKYLDAFDAYKLHQKLSASEAVKKLVEYHELGKKRETVIEVAPVQPLRSIETHNQQIAQARKQLAGELQKASHLSGQVTAINATPGIGKTHQAAQLANRTYEQGKKVAIFAPTKEIANNEWMPRLTNGYVWQSKMDACICHDKKFLSACIAMGFAMPECTQPDCPYFHQAQTSYNKQIIYQHNHLHIRDGEKIDALLLIVDESPMAALLPDRYVYPKTIKGFVTRHPDDPAVPLLTAIIAATKELPQTMADVRGDALVSAIEKHLEGVTLADAIKQTKCSTFYVAMPSAPDSIEKMAPQFLYGLLTVLEDGRDRLSFGRCESGEWGLVWHERKTIALSVYNCLYKPAILILDGSANETIYKPLCEPWPFQMVTIDCPVSPNVEIVQVNCTPSTRHVIREEERKEWLARQVAQVANTLGVVIDGGVTFKAATEVMENRIGGQWLGYGGQRGNNELADERTIAVVCSPTTPPTAMERKALALWPDLPIEWKPTGIVGAYEATDERLQALNRLHTLEELRQAVYRARPLTATAPTKLLVFTPWDLKSIGLTPDQTFTAIEHGNSTQAKTALAEYAQRREVNAGRSIALQQNADFQNGIVYSEGTPRIENDDFVAANLSDSHKPDETTPPQPAKEELARRPVYVPMVGDVLRKNGRRILVKRLEAEKVLFDVISIAEYAPGEWLPVADFVDQVAQMRPQLERSVNL